MTAPFAPAELLHFFAAALRDNLNQTGYWSRARLLDWSGPGKHWPLTGITAAGEYVFARRATCGFAAMTDPEVAALADAMGHAAVDLSSHCQAFAPHEAAALLAVKIAAQPALSLPNAHIKDTRTGRFALALADRETEQSGVYHTIELSSLFATFQAAPSGLHVVVNGMPAVLDAHWRGNPVEANHLADFQ